MKRMIISGILATGLGLVLLAPNAHAGPLGLSFSIDNRFFSFSYGPRYYYYTEGDPYYYAPRYGYYLRPGYIYYGYPEYVIERGPRSSYQSYYVPRGEDNKALIRVVVPDPAARVWIDDALTQQQGRERVFRTPELDRNKLLTYKIKVSWMEGDREMVRERQINVRAGQETFVNFVGGTDRGLLRRRWQPRTSEEPPLPRPVEPPLAK